MSRRRSGRPYRFAAWHECHPGAGHLGRFTRDAVTASKEQSHADKDDEATADGSQPAD